MKLANLRSKAKNNKSSSEAASAAANDTASADKLQEQTDQQLTPPSSSETDPAADCGMATLKRHKKKRKKVKVGDDCRTSDEHLHCKSLKPNGMSKKKRKKQHGDNLSEVPVECSSDSQNVKTCRQKKGIPSTTAAIELNESEHTSLRSRKRKKSTRVDYDTR